MNRFLNQLTVVPKEKSRVISASFSSVSAEKAATIANTLADEYIMSRLEGKFKSTERANDWLGTRIEELRDNVQKIEREVEAARERLGLLGGDGITLASRELIELNTQLVMTRSERAEAEARLGQIEEISPDSNDNESLNEVLDSNLIQRLREQESEVERRVAELSSEYGDRHPKMIQLRAEANDLAARIDSEIGRIVVTDLRGFVGQGIKLGEIRVCELDIFFQAQAQQPGEIAKALRLGQWVGWRALRQNLLPSLLQLITEIVPQLFTQ